MQESTLRKAPNGNRAGFACDGGPSFDERIRFIENLRARGGPRPGEYDSLSCWFRDVMVDFRNGTLSQQQRTELWRCFGEAFSERTMQGRSFRTPLGYRGDFETLDRIYDRWISPDPALARWDRFFQAQAAARAVRNRVAYLDAVIQRARERSRGREITVASVGCGPGREILEYLKRHGPEGVRFIALDRDARAIEYARTACGDHAPAVRFRCANVLRYPWRERPDVIWASGLFDYFDDRVFVTAVRRLYRALARKGELVIGNFSTSNPTRDYMEFGDWLLVHRSPQDLIRLALQAGVPLSGSSVGREPAGVNLFLHLR